MKKTKVMFVCLGNICRSPLAHAVFESELKKRKLSSSFIVESSGTSGWHVGELPDSRMIREAKKHKVKMNHLARAFCREDGENFDHIYAMDRSNYKNILNIIDKEYHDKVKMFRGYDYYEDDNEVPDPYYGGDDGFSEVYDIVLRTCTNIIDHFIEAENC